MKLKNHEHRTKMILQVSKTLILSLVILLMFSCNKSEEESFATQNIIPVLIGKGSVSNPNSPLLLNELIANQTQWNTLLTSMNSVNNVSNNFTETNINFSDFDVIAVFSNSNSILNSASTVDIISINENQTERVVVVGNLINGISADVAQPFHIVKIPKSTKPVIFQ